MARIARRSLRIKALPLFSLGQPWQSVCDSSGILPLRLYEPRYVELARRVLPPAGEGKFGYAEVYPPKVGGAGVLAQVEQFRWALSGEGTDQKEEDQQKVALLVARAARRFRILALRSEEVEASQPPLLLAHVQLLEDRDTARGPGVEGWNYWTQPPGPGEDAPAGQKQRADGVQAGTVLIARVSVPVFEDAESWHAVAHVAHGISVVAAGPPRVVQGYLMVPIVPSGAVELTHFRGRGSDGEAAMPSQEDLEALVRDLSGESASSASSPSSPRPASGWGGGGRKSHRSRGGGRG